MEPSTQKDNTNQKQLFFKLGFILLLILLLLIPVSLIQGLIEEREGLQRSVEEEIASL
jgi:inner membrane protein